MFTHKGYIVGNDNRTPAGWRRLVSLRETKTFWIDKTGNKYRKANGSQVGIGKWAVSRLDVETIVEMEKQLLTYSISIAINRLSTVGEQT